MAGRPRSLPGTAPLSSPIPFYFFLFTFYLPSTPCPCLYLYQANRRHLSGSVVRACRVFAKLPAASAPADVQPAVVHCPGFLLVRPLAPAQPYVGRAPLRVVAAQAAVLVVLPASRFLAPLCRRSAHPCALL